MPNRADIERVERDLLARSPALLGSWIGTFDDLFARIAGDDSERAGIARRRISRLQRSLLLAGVVARTPLNGLADSARFPGFTESLGETIAELESGLLEPSDLDGGLRDLYLAYRSELERLGLSDVELERRRAADLAGGRLDVWDGRPVFAYGFEDLTGAQWKLLEALAARSDVTVSLPYERGRPVFASLERTARDLARVAGDRVEELPAQNWYGAPSLAYLERTLLEESRQLALPLDRAYRFLVAAVGRVSHEI